MLSRKKRKKKNIFIFLNNPKFLTIIGFLIILLISFSWYQNFIQSYRANKEIRELNKEIDKLNSKNEKLRKSIMYLESDQFIEEQGRISLGLKKQGEKVIVVKNKDLSLDNTIKKIDKNSNDNSNIQNWWKYFFEKK